MRPIRLTCVVGARPNFIKMAAILDAVDARPEFEARLIHTGQHFSSEMSQTFFEELKLREPDVHLGSGGGSQTQQTAEIMRRIESQLASGQPDALVVVGDVNSTLASTLVAAKLGLPVAHVEAGLRSFDRSMPEEVNRVVTDVLSDYLFVSEPSGVENLRAEGVPEERVFLVGNVMIDTLLRFRERAANTDVHQRLGLKPHHYAHPHYVVATLHRPSNVDDAERLNSLMQALREVATRLPVVFPVHPRTKKVIEHAAIDTTGLTVCPPLGYLDFLHLQSQARVVVTDSGGIQEETTVLGVPCLTVRDNTERPITISEGTNRLIGTNYEDIPPAVNAVLAEPSSPGPAPALWDGKAADRILDVLEQVRLGPPAR